MESLREVVLRFASLVEQKENMKRLTKGWEPFIQLDCTDSDQRYTLAIRNCGLEKLYDGLENHSHLITIRGATGILSEVFDGRMSPAQAIIDGKMEVYGEDKDLIKLDAITLILWDA